MNPTDPPEFVILGAGTWGMALAGVLNARGHSLRVWDFYPSVIENLKKDRVHPRLKGFVVPEELRLTADLTEAVRGARVGVMVVPSTAMRATCEAIRDAALEAEIQTWVLCSKGIEAGSLMTLDRIVAEVLGEAAKGRIGTLSGPSHAEEVARGLPTTVVACAPDPALAREIQGYFHSPRFRVYTDHDMLGAELGGALKNVIAIAAGVSDGMGFGDNARAALATRGLAEIVRLGVALGAQRETFMGLTGMGDLIVTTGSPLSRNHQFGEHLARGCSCEEALEKVGMVVEGFATVKSAHQLAREHRVEAPITEAVYRVCHRGLPAREALEALLAREAKPEKE